MQQSLCHPSWGQEVDRVGGQATFPLAILFIRMLKTMGRDRCKVSGVSKLLLPCAMEGSVFQKPQSDPQFLFQNANQENCPFPEILQKETISCLILTLMI